MVKINDMQVVNQNGVNTPVLHGHNLTVTKASPTFKIGENVRCYITKCDNGRFAVFSSSGVNDTKYHMFDSEEQLHEHFDEATV